MEEQQRIERYLNNEMTKEERILFETEMEDNLELDQRVTINKDIFDFMDSREPVLETKLEQLGDKYFHKKKQTKSFNRW